MYLFCYMYICSITRNCNSLRNKNIFFLLKVRLLAELFFTRWLFLSRFCPDDERCRRLSHWNSFACKPGGNTTVTSPSTLPIGVSLERTLMLQKYSISSRVVFEILHAHLLNKTWQLVYINLFMMVVQRSTIAIQVHLIKEDISPLHSPLKLNHTVTF